VSPNGRLAALAFAQQQPGSVASDDPFARPDVAELAIELATFRLVSF